MDRILKILKKENGPRASSAPALELNTIIFKHVHWYMQLISGERLQDHWSSGIENCTIMRHITMRLNCNYFLDLVSELGTENLRLCLKVIDAYILLGPREFMEVCKIL